MTSNLKTARNHVASLRQALLTPSPEEIERCLPGLAEAAACLGRIEQSLRAAPPQPELAGELKALQRDLKMVARMIEHSANFYRGWASLLGAAAGGYTHSGRAAELPVAATLAVQG
ncbi:MAG TPA: hypothetical protein VMB85_01670 [Bryobacteraceae bacterium]|jgi:hypothetical protein|nr:hypothetical protein [Bryobacteraceae bacterium]